MEDEIYDKYKEAGRIAVEAMDMGVEKIQEGMALKDLANQIEEFIMKKETKPAFPVNISINERAAHYTPSAWDDSVFSSGQMVKLDLGVQVEGYIADIARTKIVGGKGDEKLVEASREALFRAIEIIKPGVTTSQIGEVIENTIKDMGYRPISNLTGHMLSKNSLHGGVTIPNIKTPHADTLHEGEVFAIEPFATDGEGTVHDEKDALIFKYLGDRPLRLREARIVQDYVKNNFGSLPFAERWVSRLVPRFKLNQALRQLVYSKSIYAYHILKEKSGGTVSQAEHTVIVTEDGCEVTTI